MSENFDFIVVGGGTAGCLLAAQLASTESRPTVLLVEAGAEPVGDTLRAPYDRYTPVFTRPDLDHGYKTTAQGQLNGRDLPYARGKGLGGSSISNFMVYLNGPAEDYDRWAERVGDANWQWARTSQQLKEIEHFHTEHSNSYAKYARPNGEAHGTSGMVDVSLPTKLEKGIDLLIDAAADYGYPRNLDMSSGNPVGVGIFPSSYGNGHRTTSATAHLASKPDNLVIWMHASVARLLFQSQKVVGIKCVNGREAFSNKEVILCAGAFDSPKILLLSGVGPTAELAAHGIASVHDLPGIGKNLQDHPCVFLTTEVDPTLSEIHAFESNTAAVLAARQEWLATGTGPLTHHNGTIFGAFLKLPHLDQSPEYLALDINTQSHLSKPGVPHYEIANGSVLVPPNYVVPQTSSYMTPLAILMNPQSRGSVTLQSADPIDAPLIDLKLLNHPFDRKVMVDLIRATVKFQQESAVGKYFRRYILGPKSVSDEDILEFINETAVPVWHANGTVKMGKTDDPTACVDSKFCVRGVDSLRVADLSVAPFTMNNHPQSTAYLIGHKAAAAIIEQWKL